MQLLAPAKVNLSFEIKGRRADGFHEIETLMAPVSLFDRLTFEKADEKQGIEFACDDPTLAGDDNLVVRAAKLLRERAGLRSGVTIHLEKKIPHGAGLGGGSSDAAATLIGLNKLFDLGFAQAELLGLAAQLGSDVPFFIVRSAAICRGRGEIVTSLALAQKFQLLLLKPDFGVPTSWAYSRWKNARPLPGVDYSAQEFGGTHFVNDLERPVFEKFIFLAQLKAWLRAQPEIGAALMSGSGSTVFALLRPNSDAAFVEKRVRSELDPSLRGYVTATLGGTAGA